MTQIITKIRLGTCHGNPVEEKSYFVPLGINGLKIDDPRKTTVSGETGDWLWMGTDNCLTDTAEILTGAILNPLNGTIDSNCAVIDQATYDSLIAARSQTALDQIILDSLGL